MFLSELMGSTYAYDMFKGNLLADLFSKYPVMLAVSIAIIKLISLISEMNTDSNYKAIQMIYNGKSPTASITIDGIVTKRITSWNTTRTKCFSNELSAIYAYVIENCPDKIVNVVESTDVNDSTNDDDDNYSKQNKKSKHESSFLIGKNRPFIMKDDIYMYTTYHERHNDNENKGFETYTEHYGVTLYSFTLSVSQLTKIISDITADYIDKINKKRMDNLFIYRLKSFDEDGNAIWSEIPFKSTRRFDNFYFKGKDKVISQLNKFLKGRDEYEKNGDPYSCGFGLSGPPGTGKTSFIKALANNTHRHIIEIPLDKINSEDQLLSAYFCKSFTRKQSEPYDFDKKIICFEDFDCQMGMDERPESADFLDLTKMIDTFKTVSSEKEIQIDNATIKKVLEGAKSSQKISLSTMLNILDGVRENDGRITVITSNRYESLDSALTRPGRIDIHLNMQNACKEIINEIYKHRTGKILDQKAMEFIGDKTISHAKVVAAIRKTDTQEEFLQELFDNY
jgi:hypothetical protein